MTLSPLIALTLGDPTGIGPEICLRALKDKRVRRATRLVVIGPATFRPAEIVELRHDPDQVTRPIIDEGGAAWISIPAPPSFQPGRVQEAGGRAALAALEVGHRLAIDGAVDALVTAPVCKEALHVAGEKVEGQTQLLGRWCGVEDHQMLAVAGELRVLLLTRHLPLREALEQITLERVIRHLHLLHDGLRGLGFDAPRLALAGLNPHAGERGILGREELEILEPAARKAREEGVDVTDPISPDAVFAAAAKGEFDGVLALYHDQAFIPVKLVGEGRGMTVLLGLPYLRLSPAHGVAFDLVGKGIARHEDLVQTLLQASAWAARRMEGVSR